MIFTSANEDLDAAQHFNAWASLGTALTCFVFVAAYAVLARWWRTYEGKVMMGKAVAIGLLALYTPIVQYVAPDSPVLRWLRVAVITAIGVFMVFQTGRLVTNQIGRKDQDKNRRDFHHG